VSQLWGRRSSVNLVQISTLTPVIACPTKHTSIHIGSRSSMEASLVSGFPDAESAWYLIMGKKDNLRMFSSGNPFVASIPNHL